MNKCRRATFRSSKSWEGSLRWDDSSQPPPPQESWPCTCARYACRNHSAYDIDAERTNATCESSFTRKGRKEEKNNTIPWSRLKQFKFVVRHTHTPRPDSAAVSRTWFGKTGFFRLPRFNYSNDSALFDWFKYSPSKSQKHDRPSHAWLQIRLFQAVRGIMLSPHAVGSWQAGEQAVSQAGGGW